MTHMYYRFSVPTSSGTVHNAKLSDVRSGRVQRVGPRRVPHHARLVVCLLMHLLCTLRISSFSEQNLLRTGTGHEQCGGCLNKRKRQTRTERKIFGGWKKKVGNSKDSSENPKRERRTGRRKERGRREFLVHFCEERTLTSVWDNRRQL